MKYNRYVYGAEGPVLLALVPSSRVAGQYLGWLATSLEGEIETTLNSRIAA